MWRNSGPVRGLSACRDGLIHDWIGAAFIPASNLKKKFAIIQDYDNHKNIDKPEVTDSKLITHRDNDIHKMGTTIDELFVAADRVLYRDKDSSKRKLRLSR